MPPVLAAALLSRFGFWAFSQVPENLGDLVAVLVAGDGEDCEQCC